MNPGRSNEARTSSIPVNPQQLMTSPSHSSSTTVRALLRTTAMLCLFLALPLAQHAQEVELPPHPSVGQRFVPDDVAWERPVYQTSFEDPSALSDWKLEGGSSMSIREGKLVLESEAGRDQNHLVCWLTKEMPADFLLEFTLKPQDRTVGLNIVFFSTRGLGGKNIFDPSLKPREGVFKQYHSSDLNGYHISYWAGERGFANVRKNAGFKHVASGPDLMRDAPADSFQKIRVYKRGGTIRLTVDDIISVAFDDDGKTHGPVWNHPGWIGLRQMGRTVRCEYDYLKVYPLKP